MEKYEVIIIGGGASGMMCALHSQQPTLLLEASDRLGKKILVTGNGKCNITNDCLTAQSYNTPLVMPYLQQFDQKRTLQKFAELGLQTYADDAGRRYPLSNSAHSVLDLMLKGLGAKNNVTVRVNAMPTKVTQVPNGFTVATAQTTFWCHKLVLATGGNSGTQYLQQLKVAYQPFRPSLMGLKTSKNKWLGGVRVSHVRVQCQQFDEIGEVLFKEDGISGIVIFNLSAYLSRRNVTKGQMVIDLLPDVPDEQLTAWLQESLAGHPHYSMVEILEGFLHKSLAKNIVERLGGKNNVRDLVQAIKQYPVNFCGYADNQQVHTGGVDLANLDEHLQHRQVPHLYCVGEVVNVDGVCGGYNLQWAWTSGAIVGDNL